MTNPTTDKIRSRWPDGHLAELLDAAQTQLLDDQPEEAIAIWQQLIGTGGEEADWGHLEFADYLLRTGQEDEARAELRTLMAGRRTTGMPWLLTAELLEDRGDLDEALRWYSAARSVFQVDEINFDRMRGLQAGRRRVRWALAIPLDDRDLRAPLGAAEAEEKIRGLSRLMSYPQVIDGRLQFRSRLELDDLKNLDLEVPTELAEFYYQFVERRLRDQGGGQVVLLPRRFEVFSPHVQVALDARSMAELASVTSKCDLGEAIQWPPGRNQPCWCGSGGKYKKCCGGPGG